VEEYLGHNKTPPPDPTVGPCLDPSCLESCGGPRGWALSYERGTPVLQGYPPPRTLRYGNTGVSRLCESRNHKKTVQGYLAPTPLDHRMALH